MHFHIVPHLVAIASCMGYLLVGRLVTPLMCGKNGRDDSGECDPGLQH